MKLVLYRSHMLSLSDIFYNIYIRYFIFIFYPILSIPKAYSIIFFFLLSGRLTIYYFILYLIFYMQIVFLSYFVLLTLNTFSVSLSHAHLSISLTLSYFSFIFKWISKHCKIHLFYYHPQIFFCDRRWCQYMKLASCDNWNQMRSRGV